MRLIIIFSFLFLFSCSEKKRQDIFVKRINSFTEQPISTHKDDATIYFTEEFWNYIITHFESGSVELFRLSPLPYPKSFVADSSINFAIIDSTNREKLIRYFPKDLSEKEHHNYVEEQTLRKSIDDPNLEVKVSKPKWVKAEPSIENQYQRFYDLIIDNLNDYIIFIENKTHEQLLKQLMAPRPTKT